jgi:hypothetical protein
VPVEGASAQTYFASEVGTIGTSFTFVKAQTLNPPKSILAYPVLQHISESDDQSVTEAFVSKFTDAGVTKTGHFPGVAAQKCSFIEWSLFCDTSFNNPLRVIFFF